MIKGLAQAESFPLEWGSISAIPDNLCILSLTDEIGLLPRMKHLFK